MSAISVAILEEIGFEGLDGITFEALWKRLQERDCFYDHENFYETVWQYILKNDIIYFYQLPEERKPIKIRDRMDEADEEDSKDFYSQNDCKSIKANGEMGFCMFYKERSPIEKEMLHMMSVQEIQQQYGNTFVMVASQEYRESLLFPSNKGMPSENSDTMYVMLEIGSAVPKFVRLRLLHEFLFYVIYELPGQSKPLNRDEVLQEWKVFRFIEISHKLAPFDRTVIEILPDALMRYTAFIGERKYRADFI
uniref:Uncharacterized protein n=2 Tax=Lutzomyia longipalpis TaxID=7200 RepID=A0A1B0CVR3_LUTLO